MQKGEEKNMKNLLLMTAVVALLAAPVLAGPINVTPTSAVPINLNGSARGAPIFQSLSTIGYYANNGTSSTYPLPVGDDIHAISGGTITSFKVGYYKPTTGSFNLHVSFFTNDAADSVVPATPGGGGGATMFASYVLNNLPGAGAWLVNITGVSLPTAADFWFEEDWSNMYGVTGATAVDNGGPLLVDGTLAAVGFSHDLYSQTGSLWTIGLANAANFALEFDIPEPTTIALLGLAGLMFLRRR